MTETGHNFPGQVGQILFDAVKGLPSEDDSMAGALPDNDPELGQNTSEHFHDLRPLADD